MKICIDKDSKTYATIEVEGDWFAIGIRARERLFKWIDAVCAANDDMEQDFRNEYRGT